MNEPAWDSRGIVPGFTLSADRRAELHKRIGMELPEEAYQLNITGHRVLIAPEPVSERTEGGLWKPRNTIERQKLTMGAGWIVSVGPLVGRVGDLGPSQPHPVGVLCSHPACLLGASVLFKTYTGVPIRVTAESDEWEGELWTMTDRDLIAISLGNGV